MAHVAARRTTGDVIMTDLPPEYRTSGPQKPLNTLERAERDVICRVLVESSGNKSKTARALGISRTHAVRPDARLAGERLDASRCRLSDRPGFEALELADP